MSFFVLSEMFYVAVFIISFQSVFTIKRLASIDLEMHLFLQKHVLIVQNDLANVRFGSAYGVV